MGKQNNVTLGVTIGSWGGFSVGHYKGLGVRRVCLGWVAFFLLTSDLPEVFACGVRVGAKKGADAKAYLAERDL